LTEHVRDDVCFVLNDLITSLLPP